MKVYIHLFTHKYLQVLLHKATLIPPSVVILKAALAHMQDHALDLAEPHEVHTGLLSRQDSGSSAEIRTSVNPSE